MKTGVSKIACAGLVLLSLAGSSLGQSAKARIPTVTLFLHSYGFLSRTVRVKPGQLHIAVANRTGLAQIELRLEAAGSKAGSAPIKQGVANRASGLAWSEKVGLSAGEYIIQEATHPRWTCRLIVSEK